MPNRLAKEKSPYLLQHADNPVDWHAWGAEAFERARHENKPILLSVGYSTCHWCHVMERESFSNPHVADVMNRNYVCVKLDREERPDVDKIYMAAAMALTGQGGWPLNVFLTPGLKPFYAGTYFPPASRWGRPGWTDLLNQLARLWKERQSDIESDAESLARSICQNISEVQSVSADILSDAAGKAEDSLAAAYDQQQKGFGHAPKFPMPANLRFLLCRAARGKSRNALNMVVETMRAMGRGGIFDQLGGGFSRYSTDSSWRIPHFEKMLYDNAQLLENLADAVHSTKDPELRQLLNRTVQYLRRDLLSPEGGFYCAEDADSQAPGEDSHHKSEGAFYLWTNQEVRKLLQGDEAEMFCRRYGVVEGSNAIGDPHGEFAGRNVLYERDPSAMPEEAAARCRDILFQARSVRPRPALDDKIITSWNGLAIAGLARAYSCTGDRSCLDLAESAAEFIRRELATPDGRVLWRRWRAGEHAIAGMADDYAYLAYGLLELYCANLNPRALIWAADLADQALELFGSEDGGLYQTAVDQSADLLARFVEDHDGVEPAPSSVLADVCLRLYELSGRERYSHYAERTFRRFSSVLAERPAAMPFMLCALERAQGRSGAVLVAGTDLPGGSELLQEYRSKPRPAWILSGYRLADRDALARVMPLAASIPPLTRARAYLCVDRTCGLPIETPNDLQRRLNDAQL